MPWLEIQAGVFIKESLARLIRTGRIGGTYLFYGPPGSDLEPLALGFISSILCREKDSDFCGVCSVCRRIRDHVHPDLFILEPEGAFYKIDTLRAMQGLAWQSPSEADWKVFILRQAERMRQEAANSLLKVLEEPSPHALFVLLTDNLKGILPTILSRSQRIRVAPPPPEELVKELIATGNISQESAETLARVSGGQPGRARDLMEESWLEQRDGLIQLLQKLRHGSRLEILLNSQAWGRDRAAAREKLDALLSLLRDGLILSVGGDPNLLLNVDQTDTLTSIWKDATIDEMISAFEAVVDGLNGLDRNLNVQNVLEGVFMACAGAQT
ncbi:MAG: DNA polymerase III subunit delta' [bacterium]